MLLGEPSIGTLSNVLSELKSQGRLTQFSPFYQVAVELEEHKAGRNPITDARLPTLVRRVIAELESLIRGTEAGFSNAGPGFLNVAPPPIDVSNLGFDFLRPGERIVGRGYKMDDDYKAASAMGGSPACPPGKIRRVGYTAKRKGKTLRVKSACIKDRGAKGRWQTVRRMMGIGPLSKGDLTALGYSHTKPTAVRHDALDVAVKKYGRAATIRKLNAIAVYAKRTAPSRAATYKTDMHYVQKKFA